MPISEFQNIWQNKISEDLLKIFPDNFIENSEFEILELPKKSITKGAEIFGNFEIIDTDGKTFYQSDNLNEIKYILYASKFNSSSIKLVKDKNLINKIVTNYEKHIDEILKMIEVDFKKNFPDSKDFVLVSNKIFKLLNLTRY